MRCWLLGATGVVGRSLVPHLKPPSKACSTPTVRVHGRLLARGRAQAARARGEDARPAPAKASRGRDQPASGGRCRHTLTARTEREIPT